MPPKKKDFKRKSKTSSKRVTPAKAGVQRPTLDSRFRGNDKNVKRISEPSSWQPIPPERIERIAQLKDDRPFEILGPHFFESQRCVVVNAMLPRAEEAWVRVVWEGGERKEMKKIHPKGFFQAIFREDEFLFPYRIGFKDIHGYMEETEDPYSFGTEISDFDLYLIGEGTHFKSYEKFGAHIKTIKGIKGVHFAVWAPNAKAVGVAGNFNHWHGEAHPMSRIGNSGVWGLFIPNLKEGEVYKYKIRSWVDDQLLEKSDPYAFQCEHRPRTASIVSTVNGYHWHDNEWLQKRKETDQLTKPISIYEVHLGSWRRKGPNSEFFLNYRELAHQLVEYVKEMGYTHIELLPIMEHPLDQSWGYQVLGFYAPTSRFGTPQDFMYFVDYCHQNGIGVILDWVPSHFPKDSHGLSFFDGKQIYAYEGWKKGEHKDWKTLIFDYGRTEVRNFLISNALFWLEKYHIDGLRVDAVASMLYLDYSRSEGEWEPNIHGGRENLEAISFLKQFNEVVHLNHPGVLTIAEESTSYTGVSRPTYAGGLGFSMKWNMGWMHDQLEYCAKEPVHRKHHQNMLTFSMLYAFSENFVLPISHDEVVHGKASLIYKMPGDEWQKFANVRLFLGYMYGHPGKKLVYMGCDFGQTHEWDSNKSMDWRLLAYEPHRQLKQFVSDLNHVYQKERALYEVDFEGQGFEWIDFSDADSSVVAFIRWAKNHEELIFITCNMTPVPRFNWKFGVPKAGFYEEILNSDAKVYGGSDIGNQGGVHSKEEPWQGRPFSVNVHLPPLAVNIYRYKA